jgi:hypothetical protein
MGLTFEDDGGVELEDAAGPEPGGSEGDQEYGDYCDFQLQGGEAHGHFAVAGRPGEGRCDADADAEAVEADEAGLGTDHGEDHTVGSAHGLDGSELAEIFEREVVEGLAGDHGADAEADDDAEDEGGDDAGFADEVGLGHVAELLVGVSAEAGDALDLGGERAGGFAGFGLGEDEGEFLALLRGVDRGSRVSGVNDRVGLKGLCGFADADDDGAVVVELDGIAEFEGDELVVGTAAGEFGVGAGLIDDDAVSFTEIFERAGDHFCGAANQGGVIEAVDDGLLEVTVVEADAEVAFVERDCPGYAIDGADAGQLGIGHGFGVVGKLNAGIDDPDFDITEVTDGGGNAINNAVEHGKLLGDEEGGYRDSENDAEVAGAISSQHIEGKSVHEGAILS